MKTALMRCCGLLLGTLVPIGAVQAQSACEGLAGNTVGNGVVLEVIKVTGAMTLSSQFGGPATVQGPACIVRGQIKPTADSDIRFEVWLPEGESWNGNFQMVGNGGNAGTIFYPTLSNGFQGGYATAATDTGHIGGMHDSSYAIGHPEKVTDFGWRSLEEVPVAAKAVIRAYYGRDPELSVFNGCSTGGRQALQLAQKYPDMFQGIVAGAPAAYWPELNASHAEYGKFLLSDPGHWVSQQKLDMAEAAVQEACGAVEGIIDDPGSCEFDFAQLACKDETGETCLSEGEVASLEKRFTDLVDENGELLYPTYAHGAEAELGAGWMGSSAEERFYGSQTWPFPEGFYRDYVHGDRNWTVREFDLATDLPSARNGIIGDAVYARDPDLSRFHEAGGKLLLWHGWHDMGIPAPNTVRYFRDVQNKLGADKTDQFVRLFLGTGVGHCGGGDGPDAIGGAFNSPAPVRDKEHDVVEAVMNWVKNDEAPSSIIASRMNETGAVTAQRPWCAFPKIAKWDGKSDRSKASSYSCPSN